MRISQNGARWLSVALGIGALGFVGYLAANTPVAKAAPKGSSPEEEACVLTDTGPDAGRHKILYRDYISLFQSRKAVNKAANMIDLGPAMACFAEGTPEEVMQAFLAAMQSAEDGAWPPSEGPGSEYQLNTRWSGVQGSPRALTWSFVPDGLSISSGAGEPVANSTLFAQMNAQYGGNQALWISKFESVFARWQQLSGLTYTRVTFGGNAWDDGAAWGTGGAAGFRGDLRIAMKPIDGVNGILAYNYFPSNGDMVLDGGDIARWGNASGDYINVRNVISHEHGHGMGISHVCPVTQGKLMEPFLSTNFDGPQHDDIRAAQRHYGDPYETNDTAATAKNLGTLAPGSFTLGPVPAPNVTFGSVLSIDADGENDYFRFSVGGPRTANVTVTPIGFSYNDGPQNSGCTSSNVTNSLAIANLNFEIRASDGVTVIATGAAAAAGVNEVVNGINLPVAGDYFIRIFEANTPTQSQLYHFTIATSVPASNTAPTLNPIGNKSGNELTNIGFTATATDPDAGQTLTFSLVGAPAGASINASTGVFSFTPTEAQGPGSYTFDVRVTDNGSPNLSDSETITVTVNEVNVAPVLAAIGNKSGNELTNIGFTATATDTDLPANTLSYSLVGAPAGASINPTTGVFTFTPTEAQGPGNYTFDVRVTDNGSPNLNDSETITVTVNEVNVAPVLGAIGNKSGNELTNIGFTATATDSDLPANTLTFSLVGAPAGASINPTTGVFSFTPTEAQGPGSYTFDVRVTDNGSPNLSDSETITVTVNEVNVAPVLAAIGNSTIDEETLYTFTATATDADLPANTLTFSLVGAPTGASITPGGVFTWTPTEAQGPGSYTFDVRVTDNGSPNLNDSETITLTVSEVTKTLSGNVTLLSFVGAVNAESVVIEVRQVGSTTPDEAQTVGLAANGDFSFDLANPLPAGTYDITAKGDTWLRRKLGSVVVGPTGTSSLSFVLTNGDCDGSNMVDSDDFDLLVASFGLSVGDSGFDARADLDGSGTVDSDDFDILVAAFGASGDL